MDEIKSKWLIIDTDDDKFYVIDYPNDVFFEVPSYMVYSPKHHRAKLFYEIVREEEEYIRRLFSWYFLNKTHSMDLEIYKELFDGKSF